jgi:predicted DNA-binding transcriptional regulator AlpA
MQTSTINAIKMLVQADPSADADTLDRILAACKPPQKKRDLITAKEACNLIGGGITRMTLYKWQKRGMVHPIRFTARNIRFDRAEIENLANNGVQ